MDIRVSSEDTGLYYLNARYYNPKLRRFISPDNSAYLDTGSPQGLNLYAYCGNDPVSHSDPSGRFGVLTALIIGAIVGAAVGFGIATYIDYMDDNEVFNGSVPWYNYVGAALLGGIVGGGIGASIPYLVAFAGASAFGSVPVAGGAVALSIGEVKALEAVGILAALGAIVFMSKKRPGMTNRAPFSWVNKEEGIEAMKKFNGDANKAADYIMNNKRDHWNYGAGEDRNAVKKWLDRIIRKFMRG